MFSKKENLTFVEFFFIMLFVLFFSLLLLWGAEKTFGATYSQLDEGTTFASSYDPGTRFGTGFSGPITQIRLKASVTTCVRYFYGLREYNDDSYSSLNRTIYGTPDEWNSTKLDNGDNWGNEEKSQSYGFININFSDTFDSSKYYQLWGNSDCGDAGRNLTFHGTTSAGAYQGWRKQDTSWQMGQVPYYIINPTTAPSTDNINITSPAYLSTVTSTPLTISGDFTLSTTTPTYKPHIWLDFTVKNASTTAEAGIGGGRDYIITDYSTTTAQNWSISGVSLPNISAPYYYEARARIYRSALNTTSFLNTSYDAIANFGLYSSVATTTDFYINEDGNTGFLPPIYTATSTYSTTTGYIDNSGCNDPDVNFIQGFLCSAFVPKQSTLTQFSGLFEKIKRKPPIGYFYNIKDAIGAFSTSTPVFSWDNASSSIPVFGQFRSGLTWIFWIIFGFWLFRRISHLEL